ncbi:MAG: ATP-binding cassette domain-containing protein [Desulfovibrio sp.]|nr:ATP-binding cassette domain-containing protein [Desulfovibrio sp.]
MNLPLVSVEDVSLFLPGDSAHTLVLHHISLLLHEGRHTVLFGANGSGKSTLLRLLAGELWPASGTIAWRGEEGMESSPLTGRAMTSLVSPAKQLARQKQGWSLTGLDLVLSGLDGTPLLYTEKEHGQIEQARLLSRRLDCEHLLYRDSSTLSQGQLRILLLARALIRQPALLLLDECMEGLDQEHRERMRAILEEEADRRTICYVTHLHDVPTFCRSEWVIEDGCLYTGDEGREKRKAFLSVPASLSMSDGGSGNALGKSIQETEGAVPGAALFSLRNATVFLDGTEVLHGINWTVRHGEHWFLRGENGSGKSTLLRLLYGDACCAAGGYIHRRPFAGRDEEPTLSELRSAVSLVSAMQEVQYDYPVSVLELVLSGFENSIGIYREYSRSEEETARDLILRFFPDIRADRREAFLRRPVYRLSTGEIRRLFLCRALVSRPVALLLDEPLSGLDQYGRTMYLSLLEQLAAGEEEHTPTMIFVSHTRSEQPSAIRRTALMQDGRLLVKES